MKPTAAKRLDLITVKWLKRFLALLIAGSVIAAIVGWGAILMGVK
jgi:hypothetical protein